MNSIDLEFPVYPLCGSADARVMYEGKRFAPYGVKSRCRCGMCFLSPRPIEQAMLSLYLQDDYFSGVEQGYSDYAAQEPALRATFRRLLQTLAARGNTGGDLLEIGCGYGYLLDEARPYFKRRIGTDFSARAVEQARSRADQVYRGRVAAADPGAEGGVSLPGPPQDLGLLALYRAPAGQKEADLAPDAGASSPGPA